MSEPVLEVRNLNHWFGEGPLRRQVLFDVNMSLEAGETAMLLGPSGSGKTTLLTLCGMLRSIQDGTVSVLGRELRGADAVEALALRRHLRFVFQQNNLIRSLTALENVRMALEVEGPAAGAAARARCLEALEAVGLEEKAGEYPQRLSGGQQQRVAIARALVSNPRLLIADEPTAALDRHSGRLVVEFMRQLAKDRGCAILMSTHDPRVLDFADRQLHIEDGALLGAAPAGSDEAVDASHELPEFSPAEFRARFSRFASSWSDGDVAAFVAASDRIRVAARTDVCSCGEPSDRLFLIWSGVVRALIERNGTRVPLGQMGRGSWFGDVGFLSPGAATATVRTLTGAVLISISRAQLDRLALERPHLADFLLREISRDLAARVRISNQRLQKALRDRDVEAESASGPSRSVVVDIGQKLLGLRGD